MRLYHLPHLVSFVWPSLHLFVCTSTIEPPLGIPLLYATSPSHLSPQLKASKIRYTKDSTLATNQHLRLLLQPPRPRAAQKSYVYLSRLETHS